MNESALAWDYIRCAQSLYCKCTVVEPGWLLPVPVSLCSCSLYSEETIRNQIPSPRGAVAPVSKETGSSQRGRATRFALKSQRSKCDAISSSSALAATKWPGQTKPSCPYLREGCGGGGEVGMGVACVVHQGDIWGEG